VANVLPPSHGHRAVISGSCSTATNAQVSIMKARHPAFAMDPFALARGEDVVGTAIAWACGCLNEQPMLIYATAAPELDKGCCEKGYSSCSCSCSICSACAANRTSSPS
jgi:3-dehydrotetronate 4-kinase